MSWNQSLIESCGTSGRFAGPSDGGYCGGSPGCPFLSADGGDVGEWVVGQIRTTENDIEKADVLGITYYVICQGPPNAM